MAKDIPIVLYDNIGIFSVARAQWMMRFFGAQDVRILNGGMPKWLKEGKSVVGGEQTKHHAPDGF